jgi:hypothetical protein
MKKVMTICGALMIALTLLTGCSGISKESGNSSAKETHTCATCGFTFDWACTTDVFGECVCSEGCSGR